MAIFRVQVFYNRGLSGKWTNVYHVNAADIDAANAAAADTLAFGLLSLLDSSCILEKVLVSDLAGAAFITTALNLAGTSSASGDVLPLFNSMKALFPTTGIGRPDAKFMKGFITESITTNGQINGATITAVVADLAALITDMAAVGATLCSREGDAWGAPSIQPAVQMRQMHRKRARRTPA